MNDRYLILPLDGTATVYVALTETYTTPGTPWVVRWAYFDGGPWSVVDRHPGALSAWLESVLVWN